jgi:hypothetical protein
MKGAEHERLKKNESKAVPLELWGPYVSERQWGTVREDYSATGDAWNYFPHDHARSRAYLWGEDGIAGISDIYQNLCFAIALWNGKDPILKERLFGLTNNEGNHGEDVKELYYYLDNIPTHYYMKYLYKYPQESYPYDQVIKVNAEKGKVDPEYEILDTGIFSEGKYFDVVVEYAKESSEDVCIKIEIINRSDQEAEITLLPTLWFYNRWQYSGLDEKPSLEILEENLVHARHVYLEDYYFYYPQPDFTLMTENETNYQKLFQKENPTRFVKDAFHEAIINGKDIEQLKENTRGTKFSPVYHLSIDGHSSKTIYLRLSSKKTENPFSDPEKIFQIRKQEADEFYETLYPKDCSLDQINIMRQAFAGLLWNKQYYHYDVERWLTKSDGISTVTEERQKGRNHEWKYLKNQDVMSMPDKWEYPWYASWDTAFHCISFAILDPVYAKHQLTVLMREWFMNPQGQLPAYEWDFSDVNPPVHAFAALRVYQTEQKIYGTGDVEFLQRAFDKLIINFTWWINRKDEDGNSIFEGGFLGLDNIGLFNRSMMLPGNVLLEQADGTSWMGMYALNMMDIALELSRYNHAWQDMGTKFYEHFVIIAEALNELGLWNEEDQFFYDVLSVAGSAPFPLRIRTVVGLTPLFAVSVIDKEIFSKLEDFAKRVGWFQAYRLANNKYLPSQEMDHNNCMLLSLVHKERLILLLDKLLDEDEFLSEGGVRGLSKFYDENPFSLEYSGHTYSIQYEPGDSRSDMFGGNSNWRGPVWMPINYLFIHSLKVYGDFYKDELKIEYPKGSGNKITLCEAAHKLERRIIHIFEADEHNERPVHGHYNWFYSKEENKELLQFYEYFHGDNLRGLGASHQTGWTALVANLLHDYKGDNDV